MARQTLGNYLLNSTLPKGYAFGGPVNASEMEKTLSKVAKADPVAYVDTVTQLKRLGDEFSTLEGLSVGLDDIAPDYARRDPILAKAKEDLKHLTDPDKRRAILVDVQAKLKALSESHPGQLTMHARSGGRGNMVQLMKTVSSPVAVADSAGHVVPWLIAHSYSQGITGAESWIAGDEARQQAIEGKMSVTEPGEVGKIMSQVLVDQVVSSTDCGTNNGILVPVSDEKDLVDRYLARPAGGLPRNTLLDSQTIKALAAKGVAQVTARSPLTCATAHGGVCQHCMGLSEKGQNHGIGTNVGLRAAQALSEPLTQATLSAKHSARTVKGKSSAPVGLPAIRSILEVPKVFVYSATIAEHDGVISKIVAAPQGGHYVYVNDTKGYVPPDLGVTVVVGQKVEAGDCLSEGMPRPDDIVKHKGMGAGRKYVVDKLFDLYKGIGGGTDKRHLELLAKADLNHVQIEDDPSGHFVRGDIVHFNRIRDRLADNAESLAPKSAEGRFLAEDYHQFSAGTRVTPSVVGALHPHFDSVKVTKDPIKFNFIMKPLTQTPLLREDWLAKMGHRHLKDSIEQGAQFAQDSDIHGYHPLPGYVHGLEFGNGPDGAY